MGKSLRDERCAEFNQVPYRYERPWMMRARVRRAWDRGYIMDMWVGVESEADPCAVLCRATLAGFTAKLQPRLPDGTPCSNATGVCVEGQCQVRPY